jgi:hypothetical protein
MPAGEDISFYKILSTNFWPHSGLGRAGAGLDHWDTSGASPDGGALLSKLQGDIFSPGCFEAGCIAHSYDPYSGKQ